MRTTVSPAFKPRVPVLLRDLKPLLGNRHQGQTSKFNDSNIENPYQTSQSTHALPTDSISSQASGRFLQQFGFTDRSFKSPAKKERSLDKQQLRDLVNRLSVPKKRAPESEPQILPLKSSKVEQRQSVVLKNQSEKVSADPEMFYKPAKERTSFVAPAQPSSFIKTGKNFKQHQRPQSNQIHTKSVEKSSEAVTKKLPNVKSLVRFEKLAKTLTQSRMAYQATMVSTKQSNCLSPQSIGKTNVSITQPDFKKANKSSIKIEKNTTSKSTFSLKGVVKPQTAGHQRSRPAGSKLKSKSPDSKIKLTTQSPEQISIVVSPKVISQTTKVTSKVNSRKGSIGKVPASQSRLSQERDVKAEMPKHQSVSPPSHMPPHNLSKSIQPFSKQYVPKYAKKQPSQPANFPDYLTSPEMNTRKSSGHTSPSSPKPQEYSVVKPHTPPTLDAERTKSQLESYKEKVSQLKEDPQSTKSMKAPPALETLPAAIHSDDAQMSFNPLSPGHQRRTRGERMSSRNGLKSSSNLTEENKVDHDPVREAADKVLSINFDDAAFTQFFQFVQPAPASKELVEAVAQMLGFKETDWAALNKLGCKRFLEQLRSYKLRKVQHKDFSKFEAFSKKRTLEQMQKFGVAPGQMMQWALSVKDYYTLTNLHTETRSLKSSTRGKPKSATVIISLDNPPKPSAPTEYANPAPQEIATKPVRNSYDSKRGSAAEVLDMSTGSFVEISALQYSTNRDSKHESLPEVVQENAHDHIQIIQTPKFSAAVTDSMVSGNLFQPAIEGETNWHLQQSADQVQLDTIPDLSEISQRLQESIMFTRDPTMESVEEESKDGHKEAVAIMDEEASCPQLLDGQQASEDTKQTGQEVCVHEETNEEVTVTVHQDPAPLTEVNQEALVASEEQLTLIEPEAIVVEVSEPLVTDKVEVVPATSLFEEESKELAVVIQEDQQDGAKTATNEEELQNTEQKTTNQDEDVEEDNQTENEVTKEEQKKQKTQVSGHRKRKNKKKKR